MRATSAAAKYLALLDQAERHLSRARRESVCYLAPVEQAADGERLFALFNLMGRPLRSGRLYREGRLHLEWAVGVKGEARLVYVPSRAPWLTAEDAAAYQRRLALILGEAQPTPEDRRGALRLVR
jgi:hypothetical protein